MRTERLRRSIVRFYGRDARSATPLLSTPCIARRDAYFGSGFDEALVLTVDGSGDSQCTTVWIGRGDELKPIHEVEIRTPSGWFYAAITEFLGFDAYDGEYKVMGLAAYGRARRKFREAPVAGVPAAADGWGYRVDPAYIHHLADTYSDRFTDALVGLLGLSPRQGERPLETVHEDLAFEAQRLLEERSCGCSPTSARRPALRRLCVAGGVALNVKMNSRIHQSGFFDEVFVFPVPSDSGTSIAAAMGVHHMLTGHRPAPLEHLYLGPSYSDGDIEAQVRSCGLAYRVCADVAEDTAELLAAGKVVAWFQGAMEAGPRALGARSILADPRAIESRDRVNAAIKFREYWRPFCPSLLEERAGRFMHKATRAPYMILAFDATPEAFQLCPAVVHVDGTMRPQTVDDRSNPRYYRLLKAFERRTGLPVLLNTSFNIKGEAIVCSPRDALRTFWSTGIDALAIGNCLLEKPEAPLFVAPEDAIR